MFPTIKRSGVRGFTLIELLIVVIILAILAAIAIPQFSSSTVDAQTSALDSNLSAVRTAVEQYRVQHAGNVYPGAVAATGAAACPAGGAAVQAGAAGTREAFEAQLQFYSNAAGAVCTTGDPAIYRFGPYLRQGIPMEPINNSNAVAMFTANGAPIAAAAVGGWAYNTISGQFIMNSTANDNGNPARQFSAH
jgi:general secretion pathway protein G